MALIYLIALSAVAAVLLFLIALIGISASRRDRDLKRSVIEEMRLRGTVAVLEAQVAELKEADVERKRAPGAFVPAPVMTADQRARSLEMLRGGADTAAVSAATGLSQAEVDLLQKVQRLRESQSTAGQVKGG